MTAAPRTRWALTLVGVLPCLLVPGLPDPFLLPKEALFAILVAGGFFWHLRVLDDSLSIAPWRIPFLLALLSLATSSFALRDTDAWREALWALVTWAAWLTLLPALLKEPRQRARLYAIVIGVGALQVAIGVPQCLWALRHHGFFDPAAKMAFTGTFGNPEYVAFWLVAAALVAWKSGVAGRFRTPWTLLLVLGLVLTRSRGAWVAGAVATGVMAVGDASIRPATKRRVALAALVALAAAVAVWSFLPEGLRSLHTLRGRVWIWINALSLWKDSHGAGIGWGQFGAQFLDRQFDLLATGRWAVFQSNAAMVTRVHNEYLDLLVEGGPFLLAAWLWILAASFRRVNRLTASAERALLLGLLTFTTVSSALSFPLHVLPNRLLIGAILAMAFAEEARPAIRARPWLQGLLGALFLLLGAQAAGLLLAEGLTGYADHLFRQGRRLSARAILHTGERLSSRRGSMLLLQARLDTSRLDWTSALTVLRELRGRGTTVDGLKLEGNALVEMKAWPEAREVYERLKTLFPWHVTPHYQLGRIAMALGEPETARREWELALTLRPLTPKAAWEQGECRRQLQRLPPGRPALIR